MGQLVGTASLATTRTISAKGQDTMPRTQPPVSPSVLTVALAAALAATTGCAAPEPAVVNLIADGQVVFGIFSGPTTREQGALMGQNRELDFVFYSLESGPFDIMSTKVYMEGIGEGSGSEPPHPLVLRIPPIRDGTEAARAHVAEALDADVAAIVFPHVETADEARHAVASMTLASAGGLRGDADPEAARVFGVSPEDYAARAGVWPLDPAGELVSFLLIEDQIGIENALEITSVPGISIVSPGPGDLRRAYEGDMEAVEAAIQTVLAACLEAGVPCGITAGPDDIAMRIEQGFRVFIVTSPEALAVGHEAAGR